MISSALIAVRLTSKPHSNPFIKDSPVSPPSSRALIPVVSKMMRGRDISRLYRDGTSEFHGAKGLAARNAAPLRPLQHSPFDFREQVRQVAEKNEPTRVHLRFLGLTIQLGTKHTRHRRAQRISFQCFCCCLKSQMKELIPTMMLESTVITPRLMK